MGDWFIVHWQSRVAEIRAYITPGPSSHRTIFRQPPGLLPKEGGFKLLDLGSGLGGRVTDLARRRPDGHFTAVELAPLLFAIAWLRLRLAGAGNVKLRYGRLSAMPR